MPQNDILNTDIPNFDDFELPPLPKRPVKTGESLDSAPEAKNIDTELPPLPEKTIDDSLEKIDDLPEEDNLPEAASEHDEDDEVDEIELDDDLPPLENVAIRTEPKPDEEVFDFEETEEEEDNSSEIFDFDGEYDADLNNIDQDSLVLEDLKADISPLRTREEESSRNMREKIKMNDLAMELNGTPVLDDLSDEYAPPKKQAANLVDRDQLDMDEKRILKQHLEEDLSKRPENFNARASQNMYNRLMEQKKLKIAKKGFMISLAPIVMGLTSAVISAIKLNWGSYLFFQYIAVFMVVAALMLFIKSKHVKMLSTAMYAVCLLLYVGPGLFMYVMNTEMQQAPDKIVHIVCAVIASALNIVSIIILSKNESVSTYYSSNFKRK